MSFCLRCCALVLMLCLGMSGCSPTAETQLDEQRNPYYQAGKEKLSALDYKGAVESFERAAEDNPRSALAHYELGVLFDQHENDYAAALYHYNKALKLRPTGYPAENIRQRIPACKQELVKADSLAVMNPTVLRETENLREQNQALRKQIERLQAHLASQSLVAIPVNPPGSSASLTRTASSYSTNGSTGLPRSYLGNGDRGVSSGSSDRTRAVTTAGSRMRTHSVKAGETPFSISRQYQVKLDSLLSANPGLDPKRMRIGQILYVPAS